ncbi:MAG: ABC transporter ATP-binding protein [Ilumatobacteraceae bacterium]
MSLVAEFTIERDAFVLDVDLTVEPGEVLAILGPNGSGKSTLLRSIAGLVPADRGRLSIGDVILDDVDGDVFVPPEQRPIGMVFQDYLLFDHLSVIENVAFGLRARGMAKTSARRAAAEWLQRLGLAELGAASPPNLSGGQAQRVALARALATDPAVLLLDEPLAALDAGTRNDVRRDLRRHLATFDGVRLLVTHDPLDAYALADRVAILETGRIVQTGTIAEVTAHPRSRYVADLVGTNLFTGNVRNGTLRTTGGAEIVVADAADGASFAVIRPQAITLSRTDAGPSSARNTWHGVVTEVDRLGDRARVTIDGRLPMTAEITVRALDDLVIESGDTVHATVKATDIVVYPT